MSIDVLEVMETLALTYIKNAHCDADWQYVATVTGVKPNDGSEVGNAWGRIDQARAAVAELIAVATRVSRSDSVEWEKGAPKTYEVAEDDMALLISALAACRRPPMADRLTDEGLEGMRQYIDGTSVALCVRQIAHELIERRAMDAKLQSLLIQWRHNAQGCSRHESHAAGTWRSCARDLESFLAKLKESA